MIIPNLGTPCDDYKSTSPRRLRSLIGVVWYGSGAGFQHGFTAAVAEMQLRWRRCGGAGGAPLKDSSAARLHGASASQAGGQPLISASPLL